MTELGTTIQFSTSCRVPVEIETELLSHSLNGESPRWDREHDVLVWVDTRAPTLNIYDPATKQNTAWEMPSWIGCAVLTEDGVLAALRTGLYRFKRARGSMHQIGLTPYDVRRFIFNDGGCDPRGRFLVGEMYLPLAPGDQKERAPEKAPLFRYSPNGTWIDMAASVKTSNGLAWSPDGLVMYQSDTASNQIFAFDYDVDTGQASHRRVFASVETSDASHGPDGAAVDREGFYLCALFGEGCLLRFDPNGRLERRIDLPVQYPTMPAYGGSDLTRVYVTTANWPIDADERQKRPLEGGLFSLEMPVPGLPTNMFDGSL